MTEPQHPGLAAALDQLLDLGREVESLRRMQNTQRHRLRDVDDRLDGTRDSLATLGDLVDGIRTTLLGLADQVADLAREEDEEQARAASWFEIVDPALAVKRLGRLIDWLARVYLRFPGAELPACWLWHPPVVEELLWLQRAWTEAYHGKNAATFRVADWHDRQRPNVAARLGTYTAACSLRKHQPEGELALAGPPRVLTAAAADDIARAWTAGTPLPYPTPDQLLDEREATR